MKCSQKTKHVYYDHHDLSGSRGHSPTHSLFPGSAAPALYNREGFFFLNEYLLLCCSCSVKAELTVYHHDQWSGEPANYIKMVSGSPNR